MFTYQKNQRFFAQIANGLEELGAQELSQLGHRCCAFVSAGCISLRIKPYYIASIIQPG
jgi:23S rRNA G2445 N2-methylase RlmL